jgi:predicted protein tyrosine phosphatase
MSDHNESDLRCINELVALSKRLSEKLKAGRMKCLDIIDDVDHTTADRHEEGMKYAAQEILRVLEGEVGL